MGGIAGPIQQVGNTAGQIPQTANVDFGFNNTQNVPFRPQQIPGNLGFPSPIQSQQPQQPGQVQPQFMTPARDQNPQVAELIQQGNMQGAMDLVNQLAAQNGKFYEPRPPGFVGNPVYPGQVQIQPYPMPPVQVQPPRPTVIQPGPNVFPQPQQRGLGGLQLNKFRNRLG